MESATEVLSGYEPTGDLAAAALETAFDGKSLPYESACRLVLWEAKHVSETSSLLHLWGAHDRCQAFSAASEMQLHDVVDAIGKKDGSGLTPLDCAIRANSCCIAEELLKLGCRPSKPYLVEERTPKLTKILEEHCPSCVFARKKARLEGKNIYKAAATGDLTTIETFHLSGYNVFQEDQDHRTIMQHAAEKGHSGILHFADTVYPGHHLAGLQKIYPNHNEAFVALKSNGGVLAWGSATRGGDCSEVQLQLTAGVQSLFHNDYAFAALKEGGSVVAWGLHDFGGDTKRVRKYLTGGVQSICHSYGAFAALKADGSVVSWGSEMSGGNMRKVQDKLTSGVRALGQSDKAFAALKTDGSAVVWGGDVTYQLEAVAHIFTKLSDDGTVLMITRNDLAIAALSVDGSVIAWGPRNHGGDIGPVKDQLTSGVQSIFSGDHAFAALKTDGSLVTWGREDSHSKAVSKLLAEQKKDGVLLSFAWNRGAIAAVRADGKVITWGLNDAGGDVSKLHDQLVDCTQSICATQRAFAVLKVDGSVVAWGDHQFGGDISPVKHQLLSDVHSIHSDDGCSAFGALKNDGSSVVWGYPWTAQPNTGDAQLS
eukprot:gnl/MRDRNA2_/MRDRNA2_57183_c0_seq1.p1 gnl/MRDRNA2_/MRDRNA2_57183_c0~~gnl/MRDRNA2_/MRDRNA2_57183_c0_seq1.p1  ORF type:complete len:644 (-),score=124.53 gnl/MRDRNA2_/MRDRNA2_57183_c0_seq1:39-1829(-)